MSPTQSKRGAGARRWVLLLGAPALAVAAVVAVWAGWGREAGGRPPPAAAPAAGEAAPEVGARAPEFEAVDGAGAPVRLSDFRGTAVLVNFWATWCVACRAEMPAIQATLEEHRREGFEVVAVNQRESGEAAQRFLNELGVDFRLALDPDGSIGRAYGVFGLPASFFVDRGGVIRQVWLGEMTYEMVEEFTHLTLAGAPARAPAAEPVELTVLLDPEGPGTLYLLSPAIRCDATYCARNLLRAVQVVPAVTPGFRRWWARGVPENVR